MRDHNRYLANNIDARKSLRGMLCECKIHNLTENP